MQFMDGVSQHVFAATNLLVNYPPFLVGYLLSNFIHPVYRLSRTPVSDETPSQAYRQLSLLRRRITSYHSLTGCSLTIYCCDF